MYNSLARFVLLLVIAYFAANLVEGLIWLLAWGGASHYYTSTAVRTVGVLCVYVVMRDTIKALIARDWSELKDLL